MEAPLRGGEMDKQVWIGGAFLALSLMAHGEEQNPLLGCWQCTSDGQPVPLRFEANRYIIDGEPLPYDLAPGAIRVREPDGYSLYPYGFTNGQLTIMFEDAPPLLCARTSCPAKKGAGNR